MYQIHWINGHKEGWSPLLYTKDEAERIVRQRRAVETESEFDLIAVEDKN